MSAPTLTLAAVPVAEACGALLASLIERQNIPLIEIACSLTVDANGRADLSLLLRGSAMAELTPIAVIQYRPQLAIEIMGMPTENAMVVLAAALQQTAREAMTGMRDMSCDLVSEKNGNKRLHFRAIA